MLYYFAADHLGSTSLTMDASGNSQGTMGYKPFGETRYGSTPTDRRFTGQRQEDSSLGSLYDYGARFYSPSLGRFLSADTIVPKKEDPQQLNRYSYTSNNPLKYVDPTGHMLDDGCRNEECDLRSADLYSYRRATWDQLTKPEQDVLIKAMDGDAQKAQSNWAIEKGGGSAVDVGGTLADPAMLIPVGGVAKIGWNLGEELLTKLGVACLTSPACAALITGTATKAIENTSSDSTIDPNKLSHIFDNAEHGLDALRDHFGSPEAGYRAVQNAFSNVAGSYTVQQLKDGISLNVEGFSVTVRGTIVDGVARIGTFFIKHP